MPIVARLSSDEEEGEGETEDEMEEEEEKEPEETEENDKEENAQNLVMPSPEGLSSSVEEEEEDEGADGCDSEGSQGSKKVQYVTAKWDPVNGHHLEILGLRMGLFCEIVTKRCQKRPIKMGTLLLASEMPVHIPGKCTVCCLQSRVCCLLLTAC